MFTRKTIYPVLLLTTSLLPMLAAEGPRKGFAKPALAGGRQVVANPSRDQVFPYLYDGNGWNTTWVFSNLDNHSIVVHLEFSNDDGSVLSLPINGLGTVPAIDITISTGGTYSLSTSNFASTRTSGYGFVFAANGTDLWSGYSTVRNQISGLPDLEFTVPLTPKDENTFVLGFDNTNGYATYANLIDNATGNSANILVSLQDQNGNVLTTDQISIPVFGRYTFNLTDRYPQANGLVGNITFTASGNQFVSGAGLRVGPNQSITAIPVLSLPKSN